MDEIKLFNTEYLGKQFLVPNENNALYCSKSSTYPNRCELFKVDDPQNEGQWDISTITEWFRNGTLVLIRPKPTNHKLYKTILS